MRRSLVALALGALAAGTMQGCSLLVDTASLHCAGDEGTCTDGGGSRFDGPEDAQAATDATDAGDGAKPGVVGEAGPALPPPVARWAFDDGAGAVAADSSGGGNPGALVNGPTWTQGRFGGGLSLSGVDQYVRIAPSASLDRLKTAASVTAWVFRLGDQPSFRAIVHRQAGDAYQDSFYLGFRDNAFFASVRTPAGEGPMMGAIAPNGVWLHVGVTYDGETVRMFVDGSERGNVALTGTVASETNPITIGAGLNVGAPDEHLRAVVDDVRIYDRALSPAEIAEMAGRVSAAAP